MKCILNNPYVFSSILQLLYLVISGVFTFLRSSSQPEHILYQKLKPQLAFYLSEPLQCSDLGLCKIKLKNLLLTEVRHGSDLKIMP